jgi:hypothetical protein
MKESPNGGTMDAMYLTGQFIEAPVSRVRPWEATKAALRVFGQALAESVKGDDFNRAFATSSGAQFAALPASQQNRLLDRGFRP